MTEFGDVGIFRVPGSENNYIPFGRKSGSHPRLFLNLGVVWILTALAWCQLEFVIWGGYYGLIPFYEKPLEKRCWKITVTIQHSWRTLIL